MNLAFCKGDYRGSTIALSADSGVVVDRIEYSAYGLTTYRVGLTDTPFLFNGRYGVQTDPNGLLYMRARYYNPYLCRFLNSDPSGFAGGLNHYTYANGNPVSYLDPFGLGAVGENSIQNSWIVNNNTPQLSQNNNPNAVPYQNNTSSYFSYDALVIGNGVGDVNSPILQGAANINSAAYNMLLPLPGSSVANVSAVSGSFNIAEGEAVLVLTKNGQMVAQQPVASMLTHADFAAQNGALTAKGALAPGYWVGTVGKVGNDVIAINSWTFYRNVMANADATLAARRVFH